MRAAILFTVLASMVLLTTGQYFQRECHGVNEIYTCGSACQTKCATLGVPCLIVNVRCNDGCYCKSGYARNGQGTCIPISDCSSYRQDYNL